MDLVIFDCDGVLIDSELIACSADAEALSEIGYPITTEDVIERFAGVPADAMYKTIETGMGRALPGDFKARVDQRILDKYRTELKPIEGIKDALSQIELKKCVASSSTPSKLALGLVETGLFDLVYPHVFSTVLVERGKPHPDIFLYAARVMGVDTSKCIVVEDSVAGVTAATAAGMRSVGFTGGSHCGPDHADRLIAAGAERVIDSMHLLPDTLGRILSGYDTWGVTCVCHGGLIPRRIMKLRGFEMKLTYSAQVPEGTSEILIPGGLATPHGCCTEVLADGLVKLEEATTGQVAYRMTPQAREVTITFHFDQSVGAYPDAMFTPHPSRFTRFADDLLSEIEPVGGDLAGSQRARAVACHVAARFTYGHPEAKFNDGFDVVPALGCGLTEGSCVDINTYFLAALRAAGIDAGYVTGFFFPEEKAGTCEDGHCWVVTKIDGQTEEWDIAHHLKLGTRDIRPNLNPKPGMRFACFHSMGLDFPDLSIGGVKALIEPMAVVDGQLISFEAPQVRASTFALA